MYVNPLCKTRAYIRGYWECNRWDEAHLGERNRALLQPPSSGNCSAKPWSNSLARKSTPTLFSIVVEEEKIATSLNNFVGLKSKMIRLSREQLIYYNIKLYEFFIFYLFLRKVVWISSVSNSVARFRSMLYLVLLHEYYVSYIFGSIKIIILTFGCFWWKFDNKF